ncbi:MAG: hypothetical protein EPN91_08595 [Salinibacterium sp.]|nr:MAG: hypothetical protein EPN91_08595 [Salinibacterium sp.]
MSGDGFGFTPSNVMEFIPKQSTGAALVSDTSSLPVLQTIEAFRAKNPIRTTVRQEQQQEQMGEPSDNKLITFALWGAAILGGGGLLLYALLKRK